MEAFVEQEGVDIGMAGGIALEHCRQVGAQRFAKGGVGGHGIVEHLADGQRTEILAAQLARQVIGQRLFQPLMLQNGGVDKAGQRRLARAHGFGLLAQGAPDRIDGKDFLARTGHGLSLRVMLLPRKFVQFQNT